MNPTTHSPGPSASDRAGGRGEAAGWAPGPPSWVGEPTGELHLVVGRRQGRAVATRQYHRGALRVIRPLYLDATGQVTYVTVNPGGGYLGGDTYLTDVTVEERASLVLTTQAATKVYRTPGSLACQHTRLVLGPGAVVEMVPDQLIAYRGASYLQTMEVDMDPTATLVSLDVVTPGWAPDGSTFGYDSVRLRTEVQVAGTPVLLDSLRLVPPEGDVSALGMLEGFSHLASLVVVDARVDKTLLDDVASLLPRGIRAGLTLTEGPGMVVRALGTDTGTLTRMMLDVDALLRERWFGAPRLSLRKY